MAGGERILKRFVMLRLLCSCALVCLLFCSAASLADCSELPLVSGNHLESNTSQGENSSIVLRHRTVSINPEIFARAQTVDSLRLNLFEDVQLQATRRKAQKGSRGSVLWTGALVGAEPGSIVLIASDRQISATVFLPGVTYQIRPIGHDAHLVRQVNDAAVASPERVPPGMLPDEWKLIELVNRERAAEGLSSLQCNEALSTVSRDHAADMALGNYYSHDRRDGRKFYERIFDAGYPISKCGENIAVGLTSPEEVFEAWVNSPEHRANILNCDFSEIGVGNAVGNSKTYWAQEFGAGRTPGDKVLKLAAGPSPLQIIRSMKKVFGNL
jgi:uncharacterized protein YkwD